MIKWLFRYRLRFRFSRSFCVRMIQLGDKIKVLSLELRYLFGRPTNLSVERATLHRILKLIEVLDEIVFSAGALLYREEKKLIGFLDKIVDSVDELTGELRKKRGKYSREVKELERMSKQLKEKKGKLSKSKQRKLKKENVILLEDEKIKDELTSLLNKVRSFLLSMDVKIHDMHKEAKAQRRKTLNLYIVRERIPMRSGFRLGELIGRKAIEVGSLLKRIKSKLKYFKKIIGKKNELNREDCELLVKYCSMEAYDLKSIFLWVIQESEKAEGMLGSIGQNIFKDLKLRPLIKEYNRAKARLEILRKDIQTQYRRLDNEFKKHDIAKAA